MKYLPILRFRTVEIDLLKNEIPNKDVIPLLEIVNEDKFKDNVSEVNQRFDEVMVELPIYLLEYANKYRSPIIEIINNNKVEDKSEQSSFYIIHKEEIKIPVISSSPKDTNYNKLQIIFEELKKEFKKIAIKIIVPETTLSQDMKINLGILLSLLREEDILLFYVNRLNGYEQTVNHNIEGIKSLLKEKNISNRKYILNCFEVVSSSFDIHNYNPIMTNRYSFDGFGDYATGYKLESEGGGAWITKIIKYYDYKDFELRMFSGNSFSEAVDNLKKSGTWTTIKSDKHLDYCNVCEEVENNKWKDNPIYWKRFRILHYILSILNHTFKAIEDAPTPEDLDMEGYQDLFKKEENDTD